MPDTLFVYALCDPVTAEVRYVGLTYNPAKRLGEHISEAKKIHEPWHSAPKNRWLRSLIARGHKPKMVVLEEVPRAIGLEAEQRWIKAYGEQIGGRLANCEYAVLDEIPDAVIPVNPDIIGTWDASQIAGCSVATIVAWCNRGYLTYQMTSKGRCISLSSLQDYIRSMRAELGIEQQQEPGEEAREEG